MRKKDKRSLILEFIGIFFFFILILLWQGSIFNSNLFDECQECQVIVKEPPKMFIPSRGDKSITIMVTNLKDAGYFCDEKVVLDGYASSLATKNKILSRINVFDTLILKVISQKHVYGIKKQNQVIFTVEDYIDSQKRNSKYAYIIWFVYFLFFFFKRKGQIWRLISARFQTNASLPSESESDF